jgi:hypothetical protein
LSLDRAYFMSKILENDNPEIQSSETRYHTVHTRGEYDRLKIWGENKSDVLFKCPQYRSIDQLQANAALSESSSYHFE